MSSKEANEKNIHAALVSHENDKLKELLLELKFVLKDDNPGPDRNILKTDYGFKDDDAPEILSNEDVKVRQFGAFCIASLMGDKATKLLVDAYLKETVEYNKEHLLKAVSAINGKYGFERLYDRLEELIILLNEQHTESHKHYVKEVRQLLGLLRKDGERRVFTGQKIKSEVILTTNRNFRELTLGEIRGFPKKTFNAGVMVMCDDINAIEIIRTFDEMLFVPPFDEEKYCKIGKDRLVASEYIKDVLVPFILERMRVPNNKKALPVSFRLDIKGEAVQEKEADIQRTLSDLVESQSGYRLINIRNDFDIQLRFVKRKTGSLKPLVKFFTPRDKRFDYKVTDIAAGIKPYLAALICSLCGEYFSADAAVLDPFCGAGTLLVERDRYLKTGFLFGSDIFPAACAAAEKNLFRAGLSERSKIINKDFLTLEHKERFTELITDMPFETEKKTLKDLEEIYSVFFKKSRELLLEGSYLFVYTRNQQLLKKQIPGNQVKIVKSFEISKKEGAYLFVLKMIVSRS